jgi:hypothetical protein
MLTTFTADSKHAQNEKKDWLPGIINQFEECGFAKALEN